MRIAMKRLVLLFSIAALAFMLACGKESDELVGNWKLDLGQTFGMELADAGIDQILSFRSDGSFTWTYSEVAGISGDLPFSTDGAGTWKFEDSTLTLSNAGGILYAGYVQWSYDRNTITLSGPHRLIFSRM